MLLHEYFLANIGADTAENEPNFTTIYIQCHTRIGRRLGKFTQDGRIGGPPLISRGAAGRAGLGVLDGQPRLRRLRRHDGRSAKIRQNVARFRLYRHRFLQENTRFAAFFKIYQII